MCDDAVRDAANEPRAQRLSLGRTSGSVRNLRVGRPSRRRGVRSRQGGERRYSNPQPVIPNMFVSACFNGEGKPPSSRLVPECFTSGDVSRLISFAGHRTLLVHDERLEALAVSVTSKHTRRRRGVSEEAARLSFGTIGKNAKRGGRGRTTSGSCFLSR